MVFSPQFQNIERRLRENGEDEETIAKYRDIDASLKRLEMKLREGSTLETGLRGQNKVSNLASQLSSKWERKETEKIPITRQVRMAGFLVGFESKLCWRKLLRSFNIGYYRKCLFSTCFTLA